jgi:hypothetical protein
MLAFLSGFIVRLPHTPIRFVRSDDEYLPIAQAADYMQGMGTDGADEAAWERVIIGVFLNDFAVHNGRDNVVITDATFV